MTPTRCPHCQQNTLVRTPADSVHCINRDCNGFFATMNEADYRALTPAQLASYQSGRTQPLPRRPVSNETLDAAFRRNAERQAAQLSSGERLFG